MIQHNIDGRFKDAPWYNVHPDILVGGTGGIGSNTIYCLSKSIPGNIYIIDDDIVCEHNVGTQFFKTEDIGKSKVYCIQQMMKSFGSSGKIFAVPTKIDNKSYMPITIAAFDNMEARKLLFNNWKSQNDRKLYIDGRLRASLYEVYSVLPGREEAYEKTLFDDNQSDDGYCTYKQTAHFGMLIGARITQIVCNYLTNEATGMEIANIPFFITEIGEPLFVNIV